MGETLKRIIRDPERKSFFRMGMDLSRLLIKYKKVGRLQFYGTQLMYKKDAGNIRDYLPLNKLNFLKKQYYWERITPTIKNKLLLSDFLKEKYGYAIPRYWGKIENGYFFDSENKKTLLTGNELLKDIIKGILKKTPSVFIKPVGLSGGRGHQ